MNLWFEKILPYLVLVIFHLNFSQVDNQAAAPSRDQPAKLPQVLYCPLGAPIRPVHFTEYPPNPAYLEYNLETILIADLLARTRGTKYIGREGKRIKILPLLFKNKYNYLPAYFVPMNPPLTPRPDRPLEPTATADTTSTQLFGALYITLTGLVDSMVPNSGPWFLLGQSVSYIIKLAPILWWALPTGLATPHPETPNTSTYDWIPDRHNIPNCYKGNSFEALGRNKLVPSRQAGKAGVRDLPTPGFASKSKNPGAGTITALVAAAVVILGPCCIIEWISQNIVCLC
ncbi:hypothetical protein DSO57_1016000 [Entomophthora muscae]|uniref:Uncharacterized protein n=1 Tax=Entomophthora muscae TaxID=34485 RepID=A0ACC2SU29_9FUNG|nr:hypothetical protein DSO57_1016000 [Entomophthora muscae]